MIKNNFRSVINKVITNVNCWRISLTSKYSLCSLCQLWVPLYVMNLQLKQRNHSLEINMTSKAKYLSIINCVDSLEPASGRLECSGQADKSVGQIYWRFITFWKETGEIKWLYSVVYDSLASDLNQFNDKSSIVNNKVKNYYSTFCTWTVLYRLNNIRLY